MSQGQFGFAKLLRSFAKKQIIVFVVFYHFKEPTLFNNSLCLAKLQTFIKNQY